MDNFLSPEDILKQKEISGGIKYDNPTDAPVTDLPLHPDNFTETPSVNLPDPPIVQKSIPEEDFRKKEVPGIVDLGWKNLPVGILPSRGLFYPEETQIAIRPAEVKEIRLFSTIDEGDMLDLDQKLNLILESCSRIKFGSYGVVTYKDLKQEDRFFIIMAIRDLTFIKGENRIIITPKKKCSSEGCPGIEAIELRTGVLSNYELDPQLMKYYSTDERRFVFPIRRIGKVIKMSVPSIGVSKIITDWVRKQVKQNVPVDESFVKIAPFYFDDWRNLDDKKIKETMIDSNNWTKEEFSAYFQLAEKIKIGTKLNIELKCDKCSDGEITAPIYFPSGFRSLFVISDIFGELL